MWRIGRTLLSVLYDVFTGQGGSRVSDWQGVVYWRRRVKDGWKAENCLAVTSQWVIFRNALVKGKWRRSHVGTVRPVDCDCPVSGLMSRNVFFGAICWPADVHCAVCAQWQMPKSVGVEIGVWFGMHNAVHHSWSVNGVVLYSWFAVRKYTVSLTVLNISNKQTTIEQNCMKCSFSYIFRPYGVIFRLAFRTY